MPQIPSALLPNESLPTELGGTPIVSTTGDRSPDSVPLYDHKNRTILAVSPAELPVYLQNPQYTVQKGTRLNVVDQDGQLQSVDGSEITQALQSGYRLEAPEEVEQRLLQQNFGGPANMFEAGTAGFVRGVTGGLSDVALVNAEPGQEAQSSELLRNLEAANPTTSLLSEAAGVISSLGIGQGFAAGASKAGLVAERALIKQAEKAGLSNPLARSIVTKIGPRAIGSAVEGSFYGAGQLLSEDALGKANLNAENLAAYIGTGMLINGAFGASMAGAAELAKPVGQMAQYLASPFTSKVTNALDSNVSAARLLGLTPTQLAKLETRNPNVVKDLERYLKEDLELAYGQTIEQRALKNSAIKEQSGKKIGDVLETIDTVLESNPELKPSSTAVWENVYQKVRQQVENLISTDAPGMSKYKKQVQGFMDELTPLIWAGDKTLSGKELQRVKKALDSLLNYEKEPGKWTVLQDMAFTARAAIRDEIDLLATNLQNKGLASDLAQQLKLANKQYAASATFGDFLEKGALKSADRSFGITEAMNNVGLDISRKLVVLGKIEKGRQVVSKMLDKTVQSLNTAASAAQKASSVAIPSLVNSALANDYSSGKAKAAKSQQQAYANVVTNVNSFKQAPVAFLEKSNRQTASLYKAAPQTSTQLDNLAYVAMTYLSAKMPKNGAVPTMLSSYRPPKMPSSLELAKFARILNAIEKPATIFSHLQAGTATREEIDVLKNVYPATFTDLQDRIIQELPKIQATMPYNRRIQLGLLMDVSADPSMQPRNLLALQQQFNTEEQPANGAVETTQGGLEKLGKSEQMETSTQQVQAGQS